MTIKVVSPRLKTNAFDYEDGSPWEKRTVNLTNIVNLSYDSFGYGSASFTIYNINTEDVIQPINARVSVSCIKRGSSVANFACTIAEPDGYKLWSSGVLSSPCVNFPIQIGRAGYQNHYIYCYGYSPDIDAVIVTISYDVYYKYEAGGGETFTLPADWVQNTTGGSMEQPSLPTVTTAVSPEDAAQSLSDWAEIPQKIKDAALALRPSIVYFFEQKYVTFLVLFLIMASLLSWFLH